MIQRMPCAPADRVARYPQWRFAAGIRRRLLAARALLQRLDERLVQLAGISRFGGDAEPPKVGTIGLVHVVDHLRDLPAAAARPGLELLPCIAGGAVDRK